MDCIFCKIVKGEIPSYKVYEDDKIMAFLDINPYAPGHTLIIPKEHTLDLETISEDTLNHIMNKARDIAKLVTTRLNAPGYTLIQNNGFVQEVKHFHLHVIPKYRENFEMNIKDVYEKITHEE
jgi:histidine triad (HIT) family protein